MADLKISQLTGASTPLAGTEVLPIVQSGSTVKVSVANLTAGRTQTSDGIVQGTAATGYNFSANTPAAGKTSQLLNWYEEGVFVSQLWFGSTQIATYNAQGGWYTRIGNTVFFTVFIQVRTKGAGTGAVTVRGLPYTSNSSTSHKYSFSVTGQSLAGLTGALFGVMDENTSQISIYQTDATGGTALTDAAFNDFSSDNLIVTGTYQV